MGNWSDLSPDLLLLIAKYITTKDHIVSKSVCKDWCSILRDNISSPCNQLPWLWLPNQDNGGSVFYSLSENKQYALDIPEFYQYRCCGTSHGWLVMVDESPDVFMLNPLTKQRIQLPPITTFSLSGKFLKHRPFKKDKEYLYLDPNGKLRSWSSGNMKRAFVRRVCLSGNPSLEQDYIVMVIYSEFGYLGFCRAGDHKWTSVPIKDYFLSDVVYWKGMCYVADSHGNTFECNLQKGHVPTVKNLEISGIPVYADYASYLVVSSGELLMVNRLYLFCTQKEFDDFYRCNCRGHYEIDNNDQSDDDDKCESDDDEDDNASYDSEEGCCIDYEEEYGRNLELVAFTAKFKVYKLNMKRQGWTRVRNIRDNLLFVGNTAVTSVAAQDFPECKPNHVYFTKDGDMYSETAGNEIGVMNIQTHELEAFSGCSSLSGKLNPSPFWMYLNMY